MKNKIQKIQLISIAIVVICLIGYGVLSQMIGTDIQGATKALKEAGYKPLHVGGYAWFAGDKSDFYHTKFQAISPNGKDTVTGVVTKGLWFKGNTIRLD